MKRAAFLLSVLIVFSCNKQPERTSVTVKKDDVTATTSTDETVPKTSSSAESNGSSLSGDQSSLSGDINEFNIEINLSSDVLFDFDKAVLKPEAYPELQKAAAVIKQKGKGLITITGYTDSKGTDDYNKPLSLKRATAVKDWFNSHGLNNNFEVMGMGFADPVAPNTNADGSDNPEGRAKNRRVTIIVNKTKTLGE